MLEMYHRLLLRLIPIGKKGKEARLRRERNWAIRKSQQTSIDFLGSSEPGITYRVGKIRANSGGGSSVGAR